MAPMNPYTENNPGALTFLALPLELKRNVYRYLLVQPVPIVMDFLPDGAKHYYYMWSSLSLRDAPIFYTSILSACKQTYNEGLDVMYGDNTFEIRICDSESNALAKLSPENRARVRRLQIYSQPWGLGFGRAIDLDDELWLPTLANLHRLTLVLKHPARQTSYFTPETQRRIEVRRADEWRNWMTPLLEYLSANTRKGTWVDVDMDGGTEITSLIQEAFPAGFHNIRTLIEDGRLKREPWPSARAQFRSYVLLYPGR